MTRETQETRRNEIHRLIDEEGKTVEEVMMMLGLSRKTVTNRLYEARKNGDDPPQEKPIENTAGFRESIEMNADGSYISAKPLWMTLEQVKDPEYLLRAHGFEPDGWEIVSAKHNIWNTNDKIHGIQTLYASKITVKPKQQGWTFDDLVEVISRKVQPIHIETSPARVIEKRMLEIPLYDMHFGISDYAHYKQTQRDIYDLLNSKRWEEVLFVIGQDLLHNNDFRGKTANGTPIETVDIPQAWEDAVMFYSVLISKALKQSNRVKLVYSKGNHDEAMSWAFTKYLGVLFPQAELEASVEERKVHTFYNVFVGITHGDKARKDLIQLFPAEFPIEWAQTTYREVHEGHLHREDAIDGYGVMSRTLATRNKTDKWHKDSGFTTAHKRFMVFEYNTEELKHIHYV